MPAARTLRLVVEYRGKFTGELELETAASAPGLFTADGSFATGAALPVTVLIGGKEAAVDSVSAAAGVQAITVRVPPDSPAGPAAPLVLMAAGTASQKDVTLAVV